MTEMDDMYEMTVDIKGQLVTHCHLVPDKPEYRCEFTETSKDGLALMKSLKAHREKEHQDKIWFAESDASLLVVKNFMRELSDFLSDINRVRASTSARIVADVELEAFFVDVNWKNTCRRLNTLEIHLGDTNNPRWYSLLGNAKKVLSELQIFGVLWSVDGTHNYRAIVELVGV